MNQARALRVSCRPRQWIKNGLVFVPLISSASFLSLPAVERTVSAAAAFTLLSSAVYLLNDITDREFDRAHPGKKMRPIAAGFLPVRSAGVAAIALAGAALGIATALGSRVLLVFGLYAILNVGYSLGWRKEPILDVLLVSAGFVLRPVAGAFAIPVRVSAWLFVVSLLLSLALALLKRRAELVSLQAMAANYRPALGSYSIPFLDQLIAIATGAGIISYALYTFQSEHSEAMVLTLPLFLYGVFRYLYLVYERKAGANPEEIFFQDRALQIDALLYLAAVVTILVSKY